MNYFTSTVLAVVLFAMNSQLNAQIDTSVITGYHFHTYFFQNNDDSVNEALLFRWAKFISVRSELFFFQSSDILRSDKIRELSETQLAGCRLNAVNFGPRGPHPIGSYETCCNASAINTATSFFMQNHGNLTIFLHPLTRHEVLDHTTRAMWLGTDMKIDVSTLSHDLTEAPKCLPIPDV